MLGGAGSYDREWRPDRHQPLQHQDVGVPEPDAPVGDAAGQETRPVRPVDANEPARRPVRQRRGSALVPKATGP
jgi:hypothetical protein